MPLGCLIGHMKDDATRSGASVPPDSDEWDAFARHLAGESTDAESARIEAILAGQPRDREVLAALGAALARMTREAPHDIDVEAALANVIARRDAAGVTPIDVTAKPWKGLSTSVQPRWRVLVPAIAAAGLLAIGVGSWLAVGGARAGKSVAPAARMLATGVGVRDSMDLPDGSKVVLGPLSSITIASGYGATSRDVTIRGDVWFDIVHDERRPFTVNAGNAAVLDIGTRFAVRTDASEGVTVTVTEGSVSLRQANTPARQGVVLKAGDNGVVRIGGEVIARRGSATEDDVAWLAGRLVFREAPIDEVRTSIRKWYGIELRVTDPDIAGKRLTASFAGESSDRVFEVLRLALGAEILRRGDTAIVRSARGRMRSK